MTVDSYMDHMENAVSISTWRRDKASNGDSRISAETTPENSSLIDFSAFIEEYPEKTFALLAHLRPEFQELFIEYYLLHKSQGFLAKTHGQIQTRIWQNLRIVEQAVGALIVLGTNPDYLTLDKILATVGLRQAQYGPLGAMIALYAKTQSYVAVAKAYGAPVPAIRKIFRPAIKTMLASKDLKVVAVGAYMRNLTHLASLTGNGLSKRCVARIRRLKQLRFEAPPSDESPLMSFGHVDSLQNTPWNMFEISSEHRMAKIFPVLIKHGKKIFNKKAAQVFAPVDANGELELGYILARASSPALTRSLSRVHGISEMSGNYSTDGVFLRAVTIPHADVQALISKHSHQTRARIHIGDFVEILTGDAAKYHGTVIETKDADRVVEVLFPSGRRFFVTADVTALRVLPGVSAEHRAFWGEKIWELYS